MHVPEWFRAELQRYSEVLDVRWNPEIQRWEIVQQVHAIDSAPDEEDPEGARGPRGEPVPRGTRWEVVFTLRERDGGYRPLDRRVFRQLERIDPRRRRVREIIRDLHTGAVSRVEN